MQRVSDERKDAIHQRLAFISSQPDALDRRSVSDNDVLGLLGDLRDSRAALARAMAVVEAARAWRSGYTSDALKFAYADHEIPDLIAAVDAFDKEPSR